MELDRFNEKYQPVLRDALAAMLEQVQDQMLKRAMGHLLGRGKLFRPVLVLATARSCGADESVYTGLAASLEMIHTFTLIHDDLPCMDNADLRRGVSAVHREFGEAEAVLSGDALLNYALYCMIEEPVEIDPRLRLALMREVIWATHLVVEGQMLDIELEGRQCTLQQLQQLHFKKTGALLAACCAAGAMLAGVGGEELNRYREFGRRLGLLFQIRDDLLSIESTDEQMGKSLGTDEAQDKSTYPRILGLEQSYQMLETEKAQLLLFARELSTADSRLFEELVEFTAGRTC